MVDVSKKAAYIKGIEEQIGRANFMYLADFSGVTVDQMTRIRRDIRKLGDELRAVKNTMVKRAVRGTALEPLVKHLDGPTAIAFSFSDPSATAKVLVKFGSEVDKFKFKTGVLQGKLVTKADVKILSELPPREQMLSILLSVLQAPVRNLASVLAGSIRKLAYAVDAVRKQKEANAPAAVTGSDSPTDTAVTQ